jgi:Tol biopolymer transport system component
LMVAAVMGSLWVRRSGGPTIRPAQEWNVSQFTAYAGNSTGPAFSPDGSRIVFAWSGGKDEKKHELYVKALGGETLLQLTHHPSEWLSAAWSPDGTQVAFMRVDGADTGLYLVPALGGVERKLLATTTPYGLTAPISWSPDQKWIAYNDLAPGTTENRNFLYSMESHKSHLFYHDAVCRHEANLTFSNDGKQVAWYCVRALDQIDLMVGDVEGHSRRVVTTLRMPPIGLSWGFDDFTMVLTLQNAAHSEIFEVDVRNGSVTKASGAAGDLLASWAAVSPKTRSLTWSSSRYHVDLIRKDLKDGGKPGTAGERGESYLYSSRNQNQASYSPDGKHVAFDSDRSGIWNVWMGDVDGSNLIQISHGGIAGYPRWSPDSRRIAYQQYDVDTSNQSSIYIADITERTPHKLMTATQSVAAPFWSVDGRLIYFQDEGAFIRKYYQCPLQCDKNEVLVRDGQKATNMQISDDGKYWYYLEGEGDERVFRGVMKEGRVQDEKEIAGLPILNDEHAFFVAKNGIYFASAEKPHTLQYFDLATGKTKSVFTAEKPISDGIWVSSDDRYALVSQSSDTHQDIMLAEPKH